MCVCVWHTAGLLLGMSLSPRTMGCMLRSVTEADDDVLAHVVPEARGPRLCLLPAADETGLESQWGPGYGFQA